MKNVHIKGLLSLHCSTNEIANAKEVSKVQSKLFALYNCVKFSQNPYVETKL